MINDYMLTISEAEQFQFWRTDQGTIKMGVDDEHAGVLVEMTYEQALELARKLIDAVVAGKEAKP